MGLDAVAAEAPPGKPPRVSGDRPPGRFVLAAESAGSFFPTLPFSCTVHSLFRSALNLKTSADHHLLSFIADLRYAHPRGAVVRGARFDEWGVSRGDSGFFDGYSLSFGVTDTPRVLLGPERSDAEERPPAIPRSPSLVLALGRARALVAAARTERGSRAIFVGTELDSGDAFGVHLRAAASDTAAAFGSRSVPAALDAADRLIGLGTGLTPTGDDFLCGFLASRRALAVNEARSARFLDEWGQSFMENGDRASSRTNEISAAFLASAAVGRFSTALVDFARAIASEIECEAGLPALAAAVAALSSIGHGSGLDAAEGFLYGLQRGIEEHNGEA